MLMNKRYIKEVISTNAICQNIELALEGLDKTKMYIVETTKEGNFAIYEIWQTSEQTLSNL
jgi:hypothetical protein